MSIPHNGNVDGSRTHDSGVLDTIVCFVNPGVSRMPRLRLREARTSYHRSDGDLLLDVFVVSAVMAGSEAADGEGGSEKRVRPRLRKQLVFSSASHRTQFAGVCCGDREGWTVRGASPVAITLRVIQGQA